ncbi:MAG: hypothetical protein QOF51_534 [Chloroflexota bacterium]|jgi:uncharacterized damage-inducible protein DinB|nr:hypothetical protein [Chloroflexota bacterium]
MDVATMRTLYDYNYWGRDRLLGAVRELPEAEYLAKRPMDYGSIHGTLVHAYAAEVIWHSRWLGVPTGQLITGAELPSLTALEAQWNEHEAQIRAFLDGLTDEQLASAVNYRRTDGTPFSRILWQTMVHLINHGTNHRSEVAAAATQLGHSPGDLDMIVFFNERAA